MKQEVITICKKPGIKDCVRIENENSIPDSLKEVVRIEDGSIVLDCLEGEEKCPLGSVIAYEKMEDGKMNVWNKTNWKETTKEVDGVFYEIPKPNLAVKITDSLPQTIVDGLGDKLSILPDGEVQLETDWGLLKCEKENGYIVIYGKKEDGSLDAGILTKGTPSYEKYYVLDENGEIKESLQEHDKELEREETIDKQI